LEFEKKYQVSINGKKFKRVLGCLFVGRRKVQVTKFAFEDFIFVVGSAAISMGITLEFAALYSVPDVWLILSTTMAAVRTHFPRKNTSMFMSVGSLSREKK